ncbi:MogA/MoaB family molybdenum cofactor biosynthesis protein [Anthocerotibacter panamensis]|uniref:MogA/MoaB family molybdenum cofactor biosynthesis protein n=1 Tax=Anthocerotibacter panamensis TaxID=2857077 RepID=UPI001C4086ED|nr:MogA/MoaB family molybdenum cofactor biosynthesis protein [Anthocerotibacter panamensis]
MSLSAVAAPIACAVLTLSDTRTPDTDTSGQTLCQLLLVGGYEVRDYLIQPDEAHLLEGTLLEWCARADIQAVLITGGTGVSPRDITPDVLARHFDKPLPGFGELFRMLSWEQVGSKALSSRAVAGVVRKTLVFALPGSTRAVTLAMEKLILPELSHLVRLIQGEGHR